MDREFSLKILTPGRKLIEASVSEAVLPAFDGEVGVLAGHQDFVGLLGTGVLKVVQHNDDYWFMVSSGVFRVTGGSLTVLAEVGEPAGEVDIEQVRDQLRGLEGQITALTTSDNKHLSVKLELDRARARVEAHRRTSVLN